MTTDKVTPTEAVLVLLLTNAYGKSNARYIAKCFMRNTSEYLKNLVIDENLICNAFIWNDSDEGQDFWSGVDKEYREQLNYSILAQL